MRYVGLILTLSCTLAGASAADPPCRWTDALNMGLQGPVHTARLIAKRLPDYARVNPQAPIWSHDAWMVFDPSGAFVERSNSPSPDGTPEVVSAEKKRADGRIQETREVRPGQTTIWRNEYTDGPDGPVETRTYQNGQLQSVVRTAYDAFGNHVEESTYDSAGRLLNRSTSRYDSQGRVVEWEVSADELQLHVLDTYGSNGDFVGRDYLNAEGRIVMSMAFREQRLLSAWRDPDCRGVPQGGFLISSSDRSTEYNVKADCSVEMVVERHPGRQGNLENDEIERFDEAGQSLEKLTFQYERDPYGNWTKRTISARDPNTNTLVPIEEDTRIISYYRWSSE